MQSWGAGMIYHRRPMGRTGFRTFAIVFYVMATVACLVAFDRITDNYLYNDDFRWMSQARFDMRPGNLLTLEVIGFFRPLMNAMFYATERLMPGNISAYYATNLVFHLLNGVLLFHFLVRLLEDRVLAAATALFFLMTSTHWAAVGWISARSALVSTGLLLLSLLVLADRPRVRWRRWCAVSLFALALTAREDAVTGLMLLGLLAVIRRRREDTLPDGRTLAYFAATTIAYVAVRTAVIGHVTQDNWGPGPHALRNLAGGLLYAVYPWALTSLTGVGDAFEVSSHALWPEILALPVIVVLLVAGRALGRGREVAFSVAWLVVALMPASLFKFRFFTTDWLTHDRYYYLASIGACLCISSLLAGIWRIGRFRVAAKAVVLATVLVIAVGEPIANAKRAGRFRRMTLNYRNLVTAVDRRLDQDNQFQTCALQDWPMQAAFVQDVFALERPNVRIVTVTRAEEAAAYRPCLYIRFITNGSRLGTEAAAID